MPCPGNRLSGPEAFPYLQGLTSVQTDDWRGACSTPIRHAGRIADDIDERSVVDGDGANATKPLGVIDEPASADPVREGRSSPGSCPSMDRWRRHLLGLHRMRSHHGPHLWRVACQQKEDAPACKVRRGGAVALIYAAAVRSSAAIRSSQITCTAWPRTSTRSPSHASSSSLIR
jgi:hypothetical protein